MWGRSRRGRTGGALKVFSNPHSFTSKSKKKPQNAFWAFLFLLVFFVSGKCVCGEPREWKWKIILFLRTHFIDFLFHNSKTQKGASDEEKKNRRKHERNALMFRDWIRQFDEFRPSFLLLPRSIITTWPKMFNFNSLSLLLLLRSSSEKLQNKHSWVMRSSQIAFFELTIVI